MNEPSVDHSAEAWLNVLRGKIDAQIRALLHPHHVAHEPGGTDAVRIALTGLEDVWCNTPDDGDTLIYHDDTKSWQNGPSTGDGGGSRELGYIIPGELAIDAVGPLVPNTTGASITWTKAIATVGVAAVGSAITCELDVNGTTVSFTINAGSTASTLQTGLSVAWPNATYITGAITAVGSTTPGTALSMVLAE